MTAYVPFPEGALTLDQWRQVEALGQSLTAEQARWLSGYFAGLDAGLLRGGGEAMAAEPAASGRTLTILYGTETGNARDLAKGLAATASGRGLTAKLADMADYKVRQLKDEQDIVFIVSTYGEGDPPQPAVGFFEFLEGPRAPTLGAARFAVLALGDSTYELYCQAGKRIDRRLEELGATRIADRIDCDIDYDEPAAAWSQALIDTLAADLAIAPTSRPVPARAAEPPAPPAHDKRHPFMATVLENQRIVGRHSSKETRHVEIDLSGSGLRYEPGDALGLVPANDPAVVDELLAFTGLAADAPVPVRGETVTLGQALATHYEITTATPRLIEQWAAVSEAAELVALTGAEASSDRIAFLEQHHVIDILRRFPVGLSDAANLLAGLRPLQPRLYSIASSQSAVGDEAHITAVPVRYALHGSARGGVASTQIADRLEAGSTAPVYIQQNPHFKLPADDVPIIMVGPGTGIAPFRGFLQEREARSAPGPSWLVFGERNCRSDFLYQLELQQWLKLGTLSALDVAFSRDGRDKVYVQHRLLERSRDLYAWLEQGAHFYVCGDSSAMAPDVHDALITVVARESGVSRDAAEDYVRRLAADGRYQRDVY